MGSLKISGKRVAAPLLASLSFISSLYALHILFSEGKATALYDYAVWFSTFLSIFALYLDLKLFSSSPIFSTLLLEAAGGFLIIAGRIGSIIANGTFSVGAFFPLFGPDYTRAGISISLLVLPSSFLVLIFSLLHAVAGAPLGFFSGPSFFEIWFQLKRSWNVLMSFFSSKALIPILLAGAIAFAFRFYPELKWGQWLIGWDTPEYAAHLEDFALKLDPFTSYYWQGGMRNIPPMLDMILLPAALLGKAWEVFKIYPSVAFGAMASLSAAIAYKLYKVGAKGSFLTGIFTAFFILNLRISWDYQRQLIGSVFLLAFLLVAEQWKGRLDFLKTVALIALGAFASMSHEVIGLAIFASSVAIIYLSLKEKSSLGLISGLSLAIISFSLEAWYWKGVFSYSPGVGYLPIGVVSSSYSAESPWVLSYLISGMGVTIPFSLYAMSKHPRPLVNTVAIVLILAGISPLVAPSTSVTTWYRFLIGASPILSTLTGVGAVEALKDWKAFSAFLLLFSLPGFSFAYGYNLTMTYARQLREFPYALIPAPPDEQLIQVEKFFSENYSGSQPIIAEPDIARYVHLALRNPTPQQLIWSSPSNDTFCYAAQLSQEVYVVTRANLSSSAFQCLTGYSIEEDYGSIIVYRAFLQESK